MLIGRLVRTDRDLRYRPEGLLGMIQGLNIEHC